MMKIRILGFVFVLVLLGTKICVAQVYNTNNLTGLTIQQMGQYISLGDSIVANSIVTPNVARSKLSGNRLPYNNSATATVFTPSSGTIVPKKWGNRFGKTEKEKQQATEVANKLLQLYKDTVKQDRGPENDLAHALAMLIKMSYLVCADGKGKLTKEQINAMKQIDGKKQFDGMVKILRSFILDHSSFKRMSDKDKQEAFETFAITGTFTFVCYKAAKQKNDTGLMEGVRSMAQKQIEKILGPIDSIVLTNDGFTYK